MMPVQNQTHNSPISPMYTATISAISPIMLLLVHNAAISPISAISPIALLLVLFSK